MVKLIGAAQSKKFFGMRPGGVVTILDSLSVSSAAAFSTRKLRSAYAGNCMKVRRSSDNATQDIGFVSGVLDTASLLAFVGANNGFVDTWYDQSGNSRDVAQVTLANQPKIVSSGSVTLLNTLAAVLGDGATTGLNTASAASWLNGVPYTISGVAKAANTNTTMFLCGTNQAGQTDKGLQVGPYNGNLVNTWAIAQYSDDGNISYTPTTSPFISTSMHLNPTGSQLWVNGTSAGTSGSPTAFLSTTGVFNVMNFNGTSWFNGPVAELVVFSSALSTSDRQTLERNQEAYYGIAGI